MYVVGADCRVGVFGRAALARAVCAVRSVGRITCCSFTGPQPQRRFAAAGWRPSRQRATSTWPRGFSRTPLLRADSSSRVASATVYRTAALAANAHRDRDRDRGRGRLA